MNKRRIFSTFISVILGLFCIAPPLKAVPPKEDCTPPYERKAFKNLCAYVRENPDKDILKKIEQFISSDKAPINGENLAELIRTSLRCEKSEIPSLLGAKEGDTRSILEHFLKLVNDCKTRLGYDIKENETIYYTAEAFGRIMEYLIENKYQEPDSKFFIIIKQVELFWKHRIPNELLIDLSNPIPDLCKILECSEEELTELLQLQCKAEGLFEKLSPKDKMLNNFFELVRAARLKLLQLNS